MDNRPTVLFEDKPLFRTCYTPAEMFELGIFGGNYFKVGNPVLEEVLPERFFSDLTEKARGQLTGSFDVKLNQYGVDCGKDYNWWKGKGLIHPDDPNGWVEWYVKFYYGRRHSDDDRQIGRFRSFVARHSAMLQSFRNRGTVSHKTQQNLLHWSWNHEVSGTTI